MNTKLNRIKETLKNVLMQFESERITTDKGIISVSKAGDEIAAGDTVMGVNDEGVEVAVENGEYILTDGTILKIEDGKIAEVVIPEMEAPAAEEEVLADEKEEEEEENKEEEAPKGDEAEEEAVEEPAEESVEESDDNAEEEKDEEEEKLEEPAVEEEVAEEESDEIKALKAEIAAKDARIAELEARVAELENKPAAEPATEEFKKVNKIGKTGIEKLDRLAKIMGA